MIGKPEWFTRRKYSGWGLSPKTWQGWAYTLVIVAITMSLILIPFSETKTRTIFLVIWASILAIDIVSIMVKVNDEREKLHEAIAERNALWAIILIIVAGIAYQLAESTVKNDFSSVDPFLITSIIIGLIVKTISNLWLERKN